MPIARGRKRENAAATWAKIKYDRQIVAIAKVCGATTIYSDDGDIRAIAAREKIAVVRLIDIALPDAAKQLQRNSLRRQLQRLPQ